MMGMKQFDDVTMESAPGALGWIKELRRNRYGVPCALVVWEHHNGVRALIPIDRLSPIKPL